MRDTRARLPSLAASAHSCAPPRADQRETRPTSPDDGLLDALDAVAADIASRKVSLLDPTVRHGVVPTPFAPHKTRDGEVVLRRGSSCPQTGPAARRLTWTDARDVAGRLEHVQIFDTADAMAQCAGIAPESARFAPDYSPVRRDDAVPGAPDAVPASRGAPRRLAAVARRGGPRGGAGRRVPRRRAAHRRAARAP
jgi:hypothetical protein